jgi:hypothetical protein
LVCSAQSKNQQWDPFYGSDQGILTKEHQKDGF